MERETYPSDLTDDQWAVLEPLLPGAKPGGRPRSVDLREVIDGVLYVVRTGCRWRAMPHDLPPRGTCHSYYRRFRLDGTRERAEEAPRCRPRKAAGRDTTPTAAAVDSQGIATASGGERGLDAAEKVAGRERHIAVDMTGLLLAVVVRSAGAQGRDGVKPLRARMSGFFPRLRVIWADGAYSAATSRVRRTCGWLLTIVTRPTGAKGFVVLPKRWVVERTFAWLLRWRRMGRDYERLTESSEAMIRLAMIHLMVRRRKCVA
jgi:putative transposase